MKKAISLLAVVMVALMLFGTVTASASADDALTEEEQKMLIQLMHEDLERQGYKEVAPVSVARARAAIDVPSEVMELAYSDIANASPEMKEKILAARNQVIYSAKNWYVDDGGLYFVSIDSNAKTWQEVPKFSELFPGWDPPTERTDTYNVETKTESPNTDVVIENMESAFTSIARIVETKLPTVYAKIAVATPKPGTMTEPFYRREIEYKAIRFEEVITSLTKCPSLNLGVTNISVSPYQDLYWEADVNKGRGLKGLIPQAQVPKIGFRASCTTTSGNAEINIDFFTTFA